jgi:catechol 2,3-dioxygenase-like lactoylglutathione lyase family enzyme
MKIQPFTAYDIAELPLLHLFAQSHPTKKQKMKLNAGIITEKMAETKAFYTKTLGQQPLFHKPFQGQGVYLTIEVDDVDKVYNELKKQGIDIRIDIRNEPWGDRHFAIEDPNGIGIDIVKYSPAEE